MTELIGKTAVITGGESGIGLAISLAMAAAGATVVIGGVLLDAGARAVDEIRSKGGEAEFHRTDVRDATAVDSLIGHAVERNGRLDIMVNNAGVFDGFASCLETSEKL
jgi:NAD(P)-dependent dehydrogenase (short-subunit alcohol dehydrogenase family)